MRLANIRRFVIVTGFVVLLLVGTAFFTSLSLIRSNEITLDLLRLQEVVQASNFINSALEEERISIGQYPLTGNSELLDRIETAQATYDTNWEIIKRNSTPETAETITAIEEARTVYVGLLNDIVVEYENDPDNNQAPALLSSAITYYLQNMEPRFASLADPAIADLSVRVEEERTRAAQTTFVTQIALGLSGLVGLLVIVQVVAGLWFSRRMILSIQAIVDAANSISRGDMDVPINTTQGGEIGELAQAIDRMRTSLRAAIERLRR